MTVLTELVKEDFESILSKYDVGIYKSHKPFEQALGNTIYFVTTNTGRFVLKLFEKADKKTVNFQMNLIEYLDGKGVPVQRFIKDMKNNVVNEYKGKSIVLHEFVDGEHPENFSTALLKDLAFNIAKMHKVLLVSGLKGGDFWGRNHQFRVVNIHIEEYNGLRFRDEFKELVANLKRDVNKKNLRSCIIHRDVGGSNLLVKNDRLVAFMDWDDSGEDFITYDAAIFAAQHLSNAQIKLFLDEYQKGIKLNSDEKRSVYYFIMDRYLSVAGYLASMKKVHDYDWLDAEVKKAVKEYYKYKSLGLEGFMKLFF